MVMVKIIIGTKSGRNERIGSRDVFASLIGWVRAYVYSTCGRCLKPNSSPYQIHNISKAYPLLYGIVNPFDIPLNWAVFRPAPTQASQRASRPNHGYPLGSKDLLMEARQPHGKVKADSSKKTVSSEKGVQKRFHPSEIIRFTN